MSRKLYKNSFRATPEPILVLMAREYEERLELATKLNQTRKMYSLHGACNVLWKAIALRNRPNRQFTRRLDKALYSEFRMFAKLS